MEQLSLFGFSAEHQAWMPHKQLLIPPPKQFELRDYQKQIKFDIYQNIRSGTRKLLIYAPTGAGKTAILSSVLNDATRQGKRSMLIIYRDFLVEQSRASMIRTGINPDDIGVIKAGYKEDHDRPIQIARLQSLQNRVIPTDLDLNGTETRIAHRIVEANGNGLAITVQMSPS